MPHLLCGKSIINFVCAYAPRPGLSVAEKYCSYEQLILVTSVASSKILVVGGDFNGHVGQISKFSDGIMVGMVMEGRIRKE